MLNLGNMFEVNVLSYAKQLLDLQNELVNWVLFESTTGLRWEQRNAYLALEL